MKRFSVAHVFLSGIIVLIGVLVFTANVRSQSAEPSAISAPTATLFSYQGQILDTGGNPVNNTAMPITFKLFTTATGGTACWTEDHTGGNAVNVQNGQFKALLGQITPVPGNCLTGDAYLELTINGETLSPREILTSVAYAVEANTLKANAQTQGALTVNGILTVNGSNLNMINGSITAQEFIEVKSDAGGSLFLHSTSSNNFHVIDHMPGGNLEFRSTNGTRTFVIEQDGDLFAPTGNLTISQGNAILTAGKLHIQTNEDVAATGDGSFKIGTEANWLAIDNNEITSYGSRLVLQGSDATYPIETNTNLDMKNHNIVDVNTLNTSGNVYVGGDLTIIGTCSVASYGNDTLVQTRDGNVDGDCRSGSIISGAYIESNLMTAEERQAVVVNHFSEGDLLCWGEGHLELCDSEGSALVQAVADKNGRPIVLGAERIKVIGPVHKGDYLIASSTPGYAIATQNPTFGIVIAQALEDFDGETGLILAMIRKM